MESIKKTLAAIMPVDNSDLQSRLQAKLDNLTKPQGSLGKLETLAKRYGAITGSIKPVMSKKVIYTFAGDHGIASAGVSLFPKEVTSQMVLNFLRGGAGVNVLARHAGASVKVVDMGVDYDFGHQPDLVQKKVANSTKDFSKGPAMTRKEAMTAIKAGISVARNAYEEGVDIIGTGEMGIGNTSSSSAIISLVAGLSVQEVTSHGTGIDSDMLENKVNLIKQGLLVNSPDKKDPIDVLHKVGGFEIAGITGLVLGAAEHSIPVVVDGFISSVGAMMAYELNPAVSDYLFASHMSVEKGHCAVLARMGLTPIFDLDLRLGEGTGACLAISVIDAGVKILNEMATFGEAGVSEADK